MEIGVFAGIPSEEYHHGPGVSKSILDLIRRSPFHAWALTQAPDRPARDATVSQDVGTVVHCAILEWLRFLLEYASAEGLSESIRSLLQTGISQDEFRARYAPAPKFDRRTNAGKALAAEWEQANAGKEPFPEADFGTVLSLCGKRVIKSEMMAAVVAMRASVLAHPLASAILSKGEAELSAYWMDEETGVLCRCRPDWLDLERGIIADIKTTRDADPKEFWRSAWEYRYHVQAAFYLDGMRAVLAALGKPVPDLNFAFIAVESSYPYCVSVFECEPELLEEGRREYRADLNAYAEALRTGEWKAYPAEVSRLRLPPWKQKKSGQEVPNTTECPF